MACDLPARDDDLQRLLGAYAATARNGCLDRAVFVAGVDGSGRTALLRALVADVEQLRPSPFVIAGGFQGGRFVPWGDDVSQTPKIIAVLEQIVTVSDGLIPYAGLAGQLIAKSKAVSNLVKSLFGEAVRMESPELVSLLLREFCQQGPVMCVIDDVHLAPDGLWGDLVQDLAAQAADLQLFLVLALDGPQDLGPHADDEPDSLYVARRLHERGLAQWHPLMATTIQELQSWTGSATHEVLGSLLQVSGGRAEWAAHQWRHWCRREVVMRRDSDGTWSFAPGGRERARDPVNDILAQRLRQLVGTEIRAYDSFRELLVCAAFEGRRFTAEALADALGRARDDVIDGLDDTLLVNDERPDGLVLEDGSMAISDEAGDRHLWLYQFAADLDWLTLCHHHRLTDAERRDLSLRLARAMTIQYGGRSDSVAHKLARLYEAGGDPERAAYYQRMGNVGVRRDVIVWRGRNVLAYPDPVHRAERRHASQVLTAAAEAFFNRGPYDEGLVFAERARRIAPIPLDVARALLLSASFRHELGVPDRARRDCEESLSMYLELSHRDGEATARQLLGVIEAAAGNYARARTELMRALAITRAIGDLAGEASTRQALAAIDVEQGNYEQGRSESMRVLEIRRGMHDREGEANTRLNLATIDVEQGNWERARAEFHVLLGLLRELGNRDGEATARQHLALLDLEQGNYERARDEFMRVLTLVHGIGDRRAEASTRRALAVVDIEQGNYVRARRELDRVLGMHRELGDRDGEAGVWQQLGVIEFRQGAYEPARNAFGQALALAEALGDRDGQASAGQQLAVVDIEQGNLERARDELMRVLAIERELGDRPSEATTLHQLGVIYFRQGALQRARALFDTVLELRNELGDRSGEARMRHELGVIDTTQGNYQRARLHLVRALETWREIGDRGNEADTLHELGVIDLKEGAPEAAHTAITAVLALQRKLGNRRGEARAHHELGVISIMRDDYPRAHDELNRALVMRRDLGDQAGERSVLRDLEELNRKT